MAYRLPEPQKVWPECKCKRGRFDDLDIHGRQWWFQVVSHCEYHWPLMTWQQKLRIIKNENILGDFD